MLQHQARGGSSGSTTVGQGRAHEARTLLVTNSLLLLLPIACDSGGGGATTAAPTTAVSAETLACSLPLIEPPASAPVDACRDGQTVFGPQRIERASGAPEEQSFTFTVATAGPSCVSVASGGDADHRASSVTIAIDGQQVLGPDSFNQQVTGVEAPLILGAGSHRLTVKIAGRPGSYVSVEIKVGGTGERFGLVQSQHLELYNLYAAPNPFAGAPATTTLSAQGSVLRFEGLPSGQFTFKVAWALEIRDIASCAVVRTFTGEAPVDPAFTFAPVAVWDGKDESGAQVQGAFAYRLVARLMKNGPGGESVVDELATAQQPIRLDATPPAVVVVLPADGDALAVQFVDVEVTWTDPVVNGFASGLALATGKVLLDGNDVSSLLTLDATGARGTLDLSAEPDGAHTLVASIGDVVGNVGSAASSFVVDTVPPTVTWTAPPEATDAEAVPLAFDLADATSGLSLSGLELTANGMLTTAAVQCTPPSPDGVLASSCFGAYALEEGEWLLIAAVRDRAMNLGSAVRQVIVDRSPPIILLEPDLSGVVTGEDEVAVMGRVIDLLNARLWVNDQEVSVADGSFSTKVNLFVGSNTIVLRATDELGHVAERTVAVVRENKAPIVDKLTLNTTDVGCSAEPPSQSVIVANTMSPILHAEYHDTGAGVNASEIELTVDGLEYACATRVSDPSSLPTSITCPVDLSSDTHQILLTIPDATGMNKRECRVTVFIDSRSFSAPTNESFAGVIVEVPKDSLPLNGSISFSAPTGAPDVGVTLPDTEAKVVGPPVEISGSINLLDGATIRVTMPFDSTKLVTANGDEMSKEEVRAHYLDGEVWKREEAKQWIVDTTTNVVAYHTTHLSLRATTSTTKRPVASLSAGLALDNGKPAPGDQRLLLVDILNMGLMPLPAATSKLLTAPFDVMGAFPSSSVAKATPKLTESFIKAVKPRPSGGVAVLYRTIWTVPLGQLADVPVNAIVDEVAIISGAGGIQGRVHLRTPDALTWVCKKTPTSTPVAFSPTCPPNWITHV